MQRSLILAMRKPSFDPDVVAAHHRFLDASRLHDCVELSGPFTDWSGSASVLGVASLDKAAVFARPDSLRLSGASHVTVHEWDAP